MRHVFAVALLCLAACGPSVDPAFEGTWYGTAEYRDSTGSASTNATLTLRVEGDALRASGFCYDGTGEMVADGAGRNVSWNGYLRCPWPPGPACSTAVIVYDALEAEVTSGGTLSVRGTGTVTGCGYTVPVGLSFIGRK